MNIVAAVPLLVLIRYVNSATNRASKSVKTKKQQVFELILFQALIL